MTQYEANVMSHFNEEKRLQHVAVTRGREKVFLTYVRRYKIKEAVRSPFLSRLLPLTEFRKFPLTEAERDARGRYYCSDS